LPERELMKVNHSQIRVELEKIVGTNYVTDRLSERHFYASDPSAEEAPLPEFIVLPESVPQIQEIINLANREKIALYPRVGGLSLSGLALPYKGGIVLELSRMNKIIEVNAESMYAVIECGVTTGQLKTFLEENYPKLWFCMPHAPPTVGVISNAIIYGAGQLSLQEGLSSDMINGLEIVLPTGELLKTGSCALGKGWLTKSCLPDFTGLFLGWFGATGVITKASVQLWPKPKSRDTIFYKIYNLEDVCKPFIKLCKSGVCEDIYLNSWTGTKNERYYMDEKPPNVPEVILDVILSGQSRKEIKLKKAVIKKIMDDTIERGAKIEEFDPPPMLKMGMLMVPMPILFMDLLFGGGAEYLGMYIPTETLEVAYKRGVEIAKKYGFQYLHAIRPFRGGHLTGFMYAFPFDKKNPEMVQKILEVLNEICEMAIQLGGVPWKPSPTIQQVVLKSADPGFLTLMKNIKKLLDPNGIMAPGQWGF